MEAINSGGKSLIKGFVAATQLAMTGAARHARRVLTMMLR